MYFVTTVRSSFITRHTRTVFFSLSSCSYRTADHRYRRSFLRHVAGLELARQTYLFQLFSDTLDSLVMKSRSEGAYDEGICEIKGRVLTFEGDPEVQKLLGGGGGG